MIRKQSHDGAGLSPVQRKACIVLALCVLAVVLSFVLAWILPQTLNFAGGGDAYDPDLYPLDTSLGSILGDASADDSYITQSLFVGDKAALSLQKDSRITLNQYAGKEDLKISSFLKESCVAFADDSNTYTIPQAVAKMKARRVYVMIGSNDVDGSISVDEFINDYKQALQSIKSAYSYCDVIACAIPPVSQDGEKAAETQTIIDQFNQAIAVACNDMGYKYLNSPQVLKGENGYAEASYLDASTGAFNAAGANAFLEYVKSHAYQTDDTRPDTDDIPQRASEPTGGSSTPAPTATPSKLTASYKVEDSAKGTLTGGGKTGAASLEIEGATGTKVSVTAVPASGYTFYKWSDGVVDATRYDVLSRDIDVTALFNDARVELTLDRGDSTIKKGESLSISATVKLGGKEYSNANVQWAVNDELEANGGTFTFTPSDAGSYVVRAGIEINGTFSTAQITVTVEEEKVLTSIAISGTNTITSGGSTTLSANVQNQDGDVTWSCDETSWTATGNQVTFTANQEGTYHLRAKNNGAEAVFELKVSAAPTPTPSPTPSPTPTSESEDTQQ